MKTECEADFFESRGIEVVGNGVYKIIGKPYTIKFCERTEDGFAMLWECNCAAAKYHLGMCKHMQQVANTNAEYNDLNGYE